MVKTLTTPPHRESVDKLPMHAEDHATPWDFTPVFDLLKSLSSEDSSSTHKDDLEPDAASSTVKGTAQAQVNSAQDVEASLGDFSQLWSYLGVKADQPKTSVPVFEASTAAAKPDQDVYASDGALYYPPSSRNVRWKDESDGQDLAETQPDSPPHTGLTKNQRKKRNRKQRKAEELHQATTTEPQTPETMRSTQTANNSNNAAPARQAAIRREEPSQNENNQPSQPQHRYDIRPRQELEKSPLVPSHTSETPQKGSATGEQEMLRPSQGHVLPSLAKDAADLKARAQSYFDGTSKLPTNSFQTPQPSRGPIVSIHDSLRKNHSQLNRFAPTHSNTGSAPPKSTLTQRQLSTQSIPPYQTNLSLSNFPVVFTPSRFIPSSKIGGLQSLNGNANLHQPLTRNKQPERAIHDVLPSTTSPKDERNWTMLLKLLRNFPEDRSSLLSPLQLCVNRPQAKGIHVFVDASNILIGYNEYIRYKKRIPTSALGTRLYPDFQALALLLERRRPVTKRVLAGSTPELDAFERAREVGYETCILDKVFKARELTQRQRYFALRDRRRADGYLASESDSAVESDALPQQRPKWVEQGVDEVLHLKMLESIVDTPQSVATVEGGSSPSRPVMILATGDAAEAEYSAGFMKMVERALSKGWDVEIAAWSNSVSQGYRKMMQKQRFKDRLKIVELDGYADELFCDV
ncbi:MAG: hypothetical protein M1828_003506 [Chrysothrix sp. TS-e1954]|nr:MAG: hypothetical protein M1828_003506 [Chrysothrix sp. TS-e1954]